MKISVVELDWENLGQFQKNQPEYDFVLGADIVYDPTLIPSLVQTIAFLLRNGKETVKWLGDLEGKVNSHCFDPYDVELLSLLVSGGPTAIIASVVRRESTHKKFLEEITKAGLCLSLSREVGGNLTHFWTSEMEMEKVKLEFFQLQQHCQKPKFDEKLEIVSAQRP